MNSITRDDLFKAAAIIAAAQLDRGETGGLQRNAARIYQQMTTDEFWMPTTKQPPRRVRAPRQSGLRVDE